MCEALCFILIFTLIYTQIKCAQNLVQPSLYFEYISAFLFLHSLSEGISLAHW